MTSTSSTPADGKSHRTQRYLINILWTWGGVAAGIISAVLLQPYTIKKLGEYDVSIWMLVLSVVEYYWLIDLGFRSATIKMTAQLRAENDLDQLSELLSTSLTYTAIMATGVILLTLVATPFAAKIWSIQRPVFRYLILMVGTSFALGMVFNIYGACVEGFQRFDLLGRIWIITTIVRSVGVFLVLLSGHGLLWMGFVLLGAQIMSYLLTYLVFRRVAPGIHVSWRRATRPMLKKLASYGIHTFTTIVSTRLLNQGVASIIPVFLPLESVAYYFTPQKIMDYAMDGIGRVGMVTTPNASELMAKGKVTDLEQLGIYANRYCICLFMPLVSILLVYGYEIYSLWVTPAFAAASAFLLPVMVIAHALVCGQFNSISILFGMGKHKNYSRTLLAEAVITVAGMAVVLPRWGLYGGAILASSAMVANRTVAACILVSKELRINALSYAAKIYFAPIAITIATTAFLFWMKKAWLPGRTWFEIGLASTVMLIPYIALTFRTCLAEHHREFLLNRLLGRKAREIPST